MSGYRPGYSEHHSPFYTLGELDGLRDMAYIMRCPPQSPLGMDPEKAWSAMYQRGYNSKYDATMRHICTKECQQKAAS